MVNDSVISQIHTALKSNPEGLSITELSKMLKVHRNSMTRYLDVLALGGRVEAHQQGQKKIYISSNRIPYSLISCLNHHYMLALDSELNIVDINPMLKQALPRKDAVIVGEPASSSDLPFLHHLGVMNAIGNAIQGVTQEKTLEYPLSKKNRLFTARFLPVVFEDTRTGVAITLHEHADKTEMQNVLDLWKERYESISDDTDGYILRFLPDGIITYVNSAYAKIHGTTPDKIIDTKFRPTLPDGDRVRMRDHLRALTPENPSGTIEHQMYLPGGEVVWQRWKNRIITRAGTIVEIHSVGQDITDKKLLESQIGALIAQHQKNLNEKTKELMQANKQLHREIAKKKDIERQLTNSERLYRVVVESQEELVCRWKPDGTITFVNDAMCNALNTTKEELLGKNALSFVPDKDKIRIYNHAGQIRPDNPFVSIKHRIILSSGEIRCVAWSCTASFDNDGHVTEYQSVGRDIT
ncbi:MAG: PAS domain S-box protein, partial [Methanoregula sp.]